MQLVTMGTKSCFSKHKLITNSSYCIKKTYRHENYCLKVIGLIIFLLFNTVLCPEDEVMYLFKFHHFSANRCVENIEVKQAALKIMAKKPFRGIYL